LSIEPDCTFSVHWNAIAFLKPYAKIELRLLVATLRPAGEGLDLGGGLAGDKRDTHVTLGRTGRGSSQRHHCSDAHRARRYWKQRRSKPIRCHASRPQDGKFVLKRNENLFLSTAIMEMSHFYL
jgi:hypothetical protein